MATLPVPPYFDKHGEIEVICFVDNDDTSYSAKCKRHWTESGFVFGRDGKDTWGKDVEDWQCPKCVEEVAVHEKATRDD